MKNNIKMFKTISKEQFAALKFKIKREYCYFAENDLKELKEQQFENTSNNKIYQLIDEDFEWDPRVQTAFMDVTISMKNIKSLFGTDGVCCEDATLAIGLIWKSNKSRIKRCIKLGEFNNIKDEINITYKDIELFNMSSNIIFDIIIYISNPGKKILNNFIGNEKGLIVFKEHMWDILIEGNGSIFPIFEIEDVDGPLWSYECNIDEINEDLFDEEHIRININKKHSSYDMIHPQSQNYNKNLMNEILSSAITMIIIDIRDKQEENMFDDNVDFSNGSILQALIYFKNKLGFRINDKYQELLYSVKSFFDKEW